MMVIKGKCYYCEKSTRSVYSYFNFRPMNGTVEICMDCANYLLPDRLKVTAKELKLLKDLETKTWVRQYPHKEGV